MIRSVRKKLIALFSAFGITNGSKGESSLCVNIGDEKTIHAIIHEIDKKLPAIAGIENYCLSINLNSKNPQKFEKDIEKMQGAIKMAIIKTLTEKPKARSSIIPNHDRNFAKELSRLFKTPTRIVKEGFAINIARAEDAAEFINKNTRKYRIFMSAGVAVIDNFGNVKNLVKPHGNHHHDKKGKTLFLPRCDEKTQGKLIAKLRENSRKLHKYLKPKKTAKVKGRSSDTINIRLMNTEDKTRLRSFYLTILQ